MSIPAEKLNIMMEELLNKSSESAKELNIISLEEYKELNADKVAYLNFLKHGVKVFNNFSANFFANGLVVNELLYLLSVDLKIKNNFSDKLKEQFKNTLKEIIEFCIAFNVFLNDVKSYPNPRLKKSSLKLNDKTYKSFLRTKNRLLEIQQEIEQHDFTPPDYMTDALEHIEHIIKKYEEYKDYPDSFLDIFAYYYADPEDLEWTDEDREFVAKHYG